MSTTFWEAIQAKVKKREPEAQHLAEEMLRAIRLLLPDLLGKETRWGTVAVYKDEASCVELTAGPYRFAQFMAGASSVNSAPFLCCYVGDASAKDPTYLGEMNSRLYRRISSIDEVPQFVENVAEMMQKWF